MNAPMVKVWDPLVRLLHWGLAAAVLVAYLLSEGRENRQFHEIAGLTAVTLVTLRAAWGLVGPASARFASFVTGPGPAVAYLGQLANGTAPRYVGHTPAGAAMAMLLLTLVALTGLSAVLMISGYIPHDPGEDIHAFFGNAVIIVAGIHVAAALFSSWKLRENLMRAMVTGRKRAEPPPAQA